MKLFSKLKRSLRFRYTMCVILDPTDNSVIFSRKLYEDILKSSKENKNVIQFKEKGSSLYSFSLYWEKEEESVQLTEIQVAADGHVGFAAVCPTVQRIYYDYILPNSMNSEVFPVKRSEYNFGKIFGKRVVYTIKRIWT